MDQISSMPQMLWSFDWVEKLGPWKFGIVPWKEEVAILGEYDWVTAWSVGTQLETIGFVKLGWSILMWSKFGGVEVKFSACFMCFWIRVLQ